MNSKGVSPFSVFSRLATLQAARNERLEERGCVRLCCTRIQATKSQLGSAVDGNEQQAFALCRCHLSDVDVKENDRVLLKLPPFRFLAVNITRAADPMTLQTAMQRGARQMRQGILHRRQTVMQRQQRVTAKGNDERLLVDRK